MTALERIEEIRDYLNMVEKSVDLRDDDRKFLLQAFDTVLKIAIDEHRSEHESKTTPKESCIAFIEREFNERMKEKWPAN
jgi:hypothetical protein